MGRGAPNCGVPRGVYNSRWPSGQRLSLTRRDSGALVGGGIRCGISESGACAPADSGVPATSATRCHRRVHRSSANPSSPAWRFTPTRGLTPARARS